MRKHQKEFQKKTMKTNNNIERMLVSVKIYMYEIIKDQGHQGHHADRPQKKKKKKDNLQKYNTRLLVGAWHNNST